MRAVAGRRARLVLCMLAASGCTNPISNRIFYEDAAFLAALPSSERFGTPREVRLARVGSSTLLEQAVVASALVEELTVPLAASGDALRAAVPVERSEVLRAWEPTSAAARIEGTSQAWFVRGSVVRADGDPEWTIEASVDGDEPWHLVAEGRHDAGGLGEATVDLDAFAEVLGATPGGGGLLELSYDDAGFPEDATGDDAEPLVELTLVAEGLSRRWTVGGEVALWWPDVFALTDDGATWPGEAQVLHLPGQGGHAIGALLVGEDPLTFESCWSADGDELWRSGSEGVTAVGAAELCPFPSPFTR